MTVDGACVIKWLVSLFLGKAMTYGYFLLLLRDANSQDWGQTTQGWGGKTIVHGLRRKPNCHWLLQLRTKPLICLGSLLYSYHHRFITVQDDIIATRTLAKSPSNQSCFFLWKSERMVGAHGKIFLSLQTIQRLPINHPKEAEFDVINKLLLWYVHLVMPSVALYSSLHPPQREPSPFKTMAAVNSAFWILSRT